MRNPKLAKQQILAAVVLIIAAYFCKQLLWLPQQEKIKQTEALRTDHPALLNDLYQAPAKIDTVDVLLKTLALKHHVQLEPFTLLEGMHVNIFPASIYKDSLQNQTLQISLTGDFGDIKRFTADLFKTFPRLIVLRHQLHSAVPNSDKVVLRAKLDCALFSSLPPKDVP
jgi:Tfp pilus assembly protein PilO